MLYRATARAPRRVLAAAHATVPWGMGANEGSVKWENKVAGWAPLTTPSAGGKEPMEPMTGSMGNRGSPGEANEEWDWRT